MRNNLVLLGLRLFLQHAFVKPVVQTRKLSLLLRRHKMNALHARRQVLGVTQIPPQSQKVRREAQHESLHLFTRITPDLLRQLLDRLQRKLLRGNMLQHLLNLLQLFLRNKRLPKLLQVHRRTILLGNRANFVARQDVIEHIVLFQAIDKLRQQTRLLRRFRFPGRRVEKPLRIFRIVQVVPEPPSIIFIEKIQFLFRRVDLRSHLLQFYFLVFQPHLDLALGSFQIRGIGRRQKFIEETFAALELLPNRFALLFEIGDLRTHRRRLLEQRVMRLIGLCKRRILPNCEPRLAKKFLKQRVHRFEAVRVTRVVPQQDVMLQEEHVIFPAVEKNNPVL